jgi:FkbM family methyltransferase
MKNLLKRIAALMPARWQAEMKRLHFARQIRKGDFVTDEPEFKILDRFVSPGDWVVDIGANVGHYTKRFSELVGARGRVIAFEPVPATFSILSANAELFLHPNVTLINAAVSDRMDIASMTIPDLPTGLTNYYEARLSAPSGNGLSVLTLSLDRIGFDRRIAVIKIDVEGHEAFSLAGMEQLLKRDHPVLIVETGSQKVVETVEGWGYRSERMKNSPNILFKPAG